MFNKIRNFWKWLKRLVLFLFVILLASTGALLYYTGDLGKSDIVFRRMWNSGVYLLGLSKFKQHSLGDLTVHGLVSVYDGDTFTCHIDGLHPIVGESIGIRIKGIDTPEMRDDRIGVKRKAKQARDYLRRRLLTADVIELRKVERDKYFRILAEVYVDDVLISKELIAKGLAKPYDGGTKSNW